MTTAVRAFANRLVQSRLVHFVAAGAALYAVVPERADVRGQTIHVTAEAAERALVAARTSAARAIDERESRQVLDAVVTREVLAHEAIRLGLLPPDEAVRARLADAMRERLMQAAPRPRPAQADIDAEAEAMAARAEARITLDVLFVDRRRDDARALAERAARLLAREGRADAIDPPPIANGATWTEEALTRAVGPAVARAAATTPIAGVSEPVASTWGFFVVRPTARRASTGQELRGEAAASLEAKAARMFVDALARRAARSYEVRVDLPPGEEIGGYRGGLWWQDQPGARGEPVD